MNKLKKILCFVLTLGICTSADLRAADVRVASALSAADVKFTYTPSSDIKAQFQTTDTRDHMVIVSSDTNKEDEYEFREVYAFAYRGPALDGAKLERLLVENGNKKVGGWRIVCGDSWFVIYAVRVSADADGATLRTAMSLCAQSADELEAEWTGLDKL